MGPPDPAVATSVDAVKLESLFRAFVDRDPSDEELASLASYAEQAGLTEAQLRGVLEGRADVVSERLKCAIDLHLFALHRARVAMIATLLPPARRILDLGGANAPLHECGYSHNFDVLTVVDLPPEMRHTEFANRIVKSEMTPMGLVQVLYADMTDLVGVDDGSVDLVWSGQSVEHISRTAARQMYAEIKRILAPGGVFALDTPNALLTRIHSPEVFIHPDHKFEYAPQELTHDLESAGFVITRSFGLCEMPLTLDSGRFDYRDFLVGGGLSSDVSRCYIQYHECAVSASPRTGSASVKRMSQRVRSRLQRALG